MQAEGTPSRCVLIGPPGSGKTSFIHAVAQACYLSSGDALRLEFIPSTGIAKVLPLAHSIITGRAKSEASRSISEHTFDLRAYPRGRKRREAPLRTTRFSLTDGPGSAFFYSGRDASHVQGSIGRAQMETAMQGASSLVVFVDATKPNIALLQQSFPSVIERLRTNVPVQAPKPPTWRQWLSRLPPLRSKKWAELPRLTRSVQGRLYLQRVLLLLTRIDILAADAVEVLKRRADGSGAPLEHVGADAWTPREMAEAIDPVAQARSLLGPVLLNLVRDAIPPQATLAVGVCSASGFSPSPHCGPFLGRDGKLLQQFKSKSDDELVRCWRPFGVREALAFITQGRAGGTVREVTPQDLGIDDQSEKPFEII